MPAGFNQPELSRRSLLQTASCGFGYLALAGLCRETQAATLNPLAPQPTHFPPRAKRVIFIFMQGGPSHVDSFDYKPALEQHDGKKVDFYNARARQVRSEPVMKSPWQFRQYGQRGAWVSDLFPYMAQHVDDMLLIHGMHTEGVAHGPSTLFLHTGATNLIRPSVGSWVTYGLGTENENLPGFVTICPTAANGGPRNYSNAFLPTIHQGTTIGRAGIPVAQSGIANITNDRLPLDQQRRQLEFLQALNRQQATPGDDELEATIASFELGFRMQNHAPGLMDLSNETEATMQAYGIGEKTTDDFGRQCLMARRFAEAGVRYIQVNYSDNGSNPRWDQHSNIKKHADHAVAIDQPVAALLADLKQRGLLEDTLVWWGGEFGRTPSSQGNDGRDHNPQGFTVWLAGGGVKTGVSYGATDEFGHQAAENRVHMRDLHATVLHLLGLDHERLTFRQAGRDFRLTDIGGRVVTDLLA
ncbi:MAG: DUF1501 domain-containing protein [Planctomycetales bacterium]|nr:DUF1501 domain-containing protein [Planctomycetales bacterium]MCA9210150.1 DUF1501 domain-containing protein [Planctomycetales bacterium]